jgi:hypothetical protein
MKKININNMTEIAIKNIITDLNYENEQCVFYRTQNLMNTMKNNSIFTDNDYYAIFQCYFYGHNITSSILKINDNDLISAKLYIFKYLMKFISNNYNHNNNLYKAEMLLFNNIFTNQSLQINELLTNINTNNKYENVRKLIQTNYENDPYNEYYFSNEKMRNIINYMRSDENNNYNDDEYLFVYSLKNCNYNNIYCLNYNNIKQAKYKIVKRIYNVIVRNFVDSDDIHSNINIQYNLKMINKFSLDKNILTQIKNILNI